MLLNRGQIVFYYECVWLGGHTRIDPCKNYKIVDLVHKAGLNRVFAMK